MSIIQSWQQMVWHALLYTAASSAIVFIGRLIFLALPNRRSPKKPQPALARAAGKQVGIERDGTVVIISVDCKDAYSAIELYDRFVAGMAHGQMLLASLNQCSLATKEGDDRV